MTKDEALDLALEALEYAQYSDEFAIERGEKAITAIKQARALDKKAENARELGLDYEPVQEPVAMRMPKVGDRVVCIEDESLGTIVYLTAGGSPEIKFDDGSHGTYMLREFAELFGYTTPPAQSAPVQEPVKLRRGDVLRCIETDELCTVWATSTTHKTLVKWGGNDFSDYTAEQIGELFWFEPESEDVEIAAEQSDNYAAFHAVLGSQERICLQHSGL